MFGPSQAGCRTTARRPLQWRTSERVMRAEPALVPSPFADPSQKNGRSPVAGADLGGRVTELWVWYYTFLIAVLHRQVETAITCVLSIYELRIWL